MQWLEEEFLKFLHDWELSVQTREGFSNKEKKLMLLNDQTLLGLKITGSVNLKLCVLLCFTLYSLCMYYLQ